MIGEEHILSGEKQLKEFTKFLQNHDELLNNLVQKSQKPNNLRVNSAWPLSFSHEFVAPMQCRPITLDFSNDNERITTVEMVASDNKCLNKMITVFVQLCMEVRQLIDEGQALLIHCIYADEDLFLLMSENMDDDENVDRFEDSPLTADLLFKMGDFLDLYTRIEHFIERCYMIISEIIKQLAALFEPENKYFINVNSSSLHFQTVFNYLAETIILIIKFDEVLKSSQLQSLWPYLVKALRLAEQNLDKFIAKRAFHADEITGLQNILQKIEFLIAGDLFQNLIDSTSSKRSQIGTQALTQFSNQFLCYLRNALHEIQAHLNWLNSTSSSSTGSTPLIDALATSMAEAVIDPPKLLLKMNAMAILFHHLFGNLDQKLFSSIVDVNVKIAYVPLVENLIWSPHKFVARYGETLLTKVKSAADKMTDANIEKAQQQWLQSKCQRLTKETSANCVQIIGWTLKMQFKFESKRSAEMSEKDLIDDFTEKISTVVQGVELIDRLSSNINSVTKLHAHLKCPMTKQSIISICKSIELLQSAKLTFEHHSTSINSTAVCLTQVYIHQALTIIRRTKKKLLNDAASKSASVDNRMIDIISAMELAETALFGTPSIRRMLMARLALSMADPMRHFQSDQLTIICRLFAAIEYLLQLNSTVRSLSTSSFMYWHHEALFPQYLRHVFNGTENGDYERIAHFFHTAVDFYAELDERGVSNLRCLDKFMNETVATFNRLLVTKLCGSIETKLRLDVHSSLQVMTESTSSSPLTSAPVLASTEISIGELRRVLNLHPISVISSGGNPDAPAVERYLNIRDHVSAYLSQMFYNLTTVSMHDWRTYGQMRTVALQKFGIETIDDQLPTQTIEQGLDVLEIMRNIHHFVSKYLYNLNNQVFIEKNSNNKHLNTINIRHIANSLRTHGTGIINTTVNFTYQFLHKKFNAFSQFLYNEQIHSRLMKDLKWFHDENVEKPQEQQIYNFERAVSFNKGIRRLGIAEDGQSYLDLFRQLITHIGNAMGYVRMMRSGGIHCAADASLFLPVVDENLRIQELCVDEKLTDETIESAKSFERVVHQLRRNYAEETNYFRLLVDAFSPFFRNEKNAHLRLFYLIVPPLTLNYIEHIVTAKEKLSKKTKQDGTFFTDDGFAMGLAYVLRLLDQYDELNSLHWFKAVRQKYKNDYEQVQRDKEKTNKSGGGAGGSGGTQSFDAKRQQTLALSEKRITTFLQEFDLLFCNLSSAKIFFQF